MKKLAIIPARGGSKGLPGKNYKLLNGKPLISYTIQAALDSGVFDKVIVSTDSEEIAEIAKKNGAEVPFMRPERLAGDAASSDAAIMHALNFMEVVEGEEFDYVCKLQPTSPLRTKEDIREAFALLLEKKANSVVSVCECEHSPLWSGVITEDLRIDNFISKQLAITNRQKLQNYYRLNGAIYISKVDSFKKNGCFFGENSIAYIMPRKRSVDIDDILDFKFAELLLTERENVDV